MSEIIVQMNEEIIKGKIRELVRGSDLLSSTPPADLAPAAAGPAPAGVRPCAPAAGP